MSLLQLTNEYNYKISENMFAWSHYESKHNVYAPNKHHLVKHFHLLINSELLVPYADVQEMDTYTNAHNWKNH